MIASDGVWKSIYKSAGSLSRESIIHILVYIYIYYYTLNRYDDSSYFRRKLIKTKARVLYTWPICNSTWLANFICRNVVFGSTYKKKKTADNTQDISNSIMPYIFLRLFVQECNLVEIHSTAWICAHTWKNIIFVKRNYASH